MPHFVWLTCLECTLHTKLCRLHKRSCGWPSLISVRFSWPDEERQARHELAGGMETQQDPVGLLGTKAFLGPPFLDYRKWASFSLQDLPCVPKGRYKQLETGGGVETRQEQSRNSAALGQSPGFPSRDTRTVSLSCFACIGEGNSNPLQRSCLENPRMGEPGGMPSMGSHRIGHNWSDLAAAAAAGTETPSGGRS